MKIYWALWGGFTFSLLSHLGVAASASSIELKLLPANGSTGKSCPEILTSYETSQPYREGSYGRDGMIKLSAIATNIKIAQSDAFSTTWVGRLKPEYQVCTATAGMSLVDGEPYQGPSYLRVQLIDGQVKVILDMTGIRDANDFTTSILYQSVRDGNPRWTWGGTD